jgi:hypothetical protein
MKNAEVDNLDQQVPKSDQAVGCVKVIAAAEK